jgi:hypothetical protein
MRNNNRWNKIELRTNLRNIKVLEMMILLYIYNYPKNVQENVPEEQSAQQQGPRHDDINNYPKNLQGNAPEDQFLTGLRYRPIIRYRKIHPLKHLSIKRLAQSGFQRVRC